MPVESFISADSHVVEPADLWITRMDKRFRDRAPRLQARDNGDYWVVEGPHTLPIGLFGPMINDKQKGAIERGQERRYRRPGLVPTISRPGSSISTSIMLKPRLSIQAFA